MKVKGKTALITGAARGIGKAIALKFAQEGANLIISDINDEELDKTAKELEKEKVETIAIQADVSNKADVENLVAKALGRFEGIDILINNAGITRDGLFMRMKEEQWDAVMNVNLKSVFLLSQEVFLKSMMKRKTGSIVNISSLVGIIGNAGQANYCAAKAGVIGLTKSLSKELTKWNIRVNAVAPGFIDTEMTKAIADKYREEMIKAIPMGRAGAPSEVADTVCYLASEESSYISGQVLSVNGASF